MSTEIEGSYTRYTIALLENYKNTIDKLLKKTIPSEMEEVVTNTLLNKPGMRHTKAKISSQDEFIERVWQGFNEIYHSYNALSDIEVYVRRSPYSSLQIPKTRYLHYHVSNYLNEVYILQTRLNAYVKIITRAYGRGRKINETEVVHSLLEIIKPLNGIINTRGSHVHEKRYSDADFDQLERFELLLQSEEFGFIDVLYSHVLKETKKKWKKTIRENQNAIHFLLDQYFSVLYSFVFDSEGIIVIPFQSRKS